MGQGRARFDKSSKFQQKATKETKNHERSGIFVFFYSKPMHPLFKKAVELSRVAIGAAFRFVSFVIFC